jgi:hypothetical protein
MSKTIDKSINELKAIFEKINENKESLKMNIQKTFTKLRNSLNEREDKLLLEVDKEFKKIFLDENFIKKSEKLPNKISTSLEKGKLIDKNWNENCKLNSSIHSCLIIENNINNIKEINDNIIKCNSINPDIVFNENEIGEKDIIDLINQFGNIQKKKLLFDSKIEFDQDLVKSWLNNRNFTSKLLFRITKDTPSVQEFHNKCDNKGITIIFIETKKGSKFGDIQNFNGIVVGKAKQINLLLYFL